jgi:Acyl dehydratase
MSSQVTGLRYCESERSRAELFRGLPARDHYECGSVSIDQASIIAFAKEFDPQPFHVDPVGRGGRPVRRLIASGWHTAALVMRLLVENYLAAGVEPGQRRPGRAPLAAPGATGRYAPCPGHGRRVAPVAEQADRGIVKTVVEAANSGGATVMRATAINFMLVRPDPGA